MKGDAAFDVELYGMLCDRLGRLFSRLGLRRAMIDAGPSFDGYVAASQADVDGEAST